jgi:hypothetical protein
MMKNRDIPTKRLRLFVLIFAGVFSLALGLFLRHWFTERSVAAADLPPSQEIDSAVANPVNVDIQGGDAQAEAIASADTSVESTKITQRVNNIEVTVDNFRREKDRVLVDVCFDLPDDSDWTMWDASLKYGEGVYVWSEGRPIEIRKPPVDGKQQVMTFSETGGMEVNWEAATDDQKGYRCETIYFDSVPSDASQTRFTFIVNAFEAAPREGETCSQSYLEKWQAALDARKTGITVTCIEENYISGLEVADKPASMSVEEAEAIIHSTDLYLDVNGIKGPWIFEFDIE